MVTALRVALGPSTEAAMRKESVMKVLVLPNFDFLADPFWTLESSFIDIL